MGLSGLPMEGMLEAEVEEDALLAAAGSHADGERDAGNDLQAGIEIVGPPHAGAHERGSHPGRGAVRDFLLPRVGRLEQEVDAPAREPDGALPDVPGLEVRPRALAVRSPRGPGIAGIRVGDERGRYDDAQ